MALAEMCKARVIVHKSVAEELAKKVQALGCCEFIEQNRPLEGEAFIDLRLSARRIEELLGEVRFVLRLLEPYEVKKTGSIAQMLGDIPQITLSELASKVDEKKFAAFAADLRAKDKNMAECRAELSRQKALLAQVTALESIKYPLEFFTSGTDMIAGTLYSVPKESVEEMAARLAEKLGGLFEYQELPADEGETASLYALLFLKSDMETVQDIADEFSVVKVEIPKDFALNASEEKKRIAKVIAELEKNESDLTAALAACADEGLKAAKYASDYWSIIKERLDSMSKGEPTDEVFIWSFWLPASQKDKLEGAVRSFDSLSELAFIDPEEGEEPPTLLRNVPWSSCVEPLTLMYGTPSYGGVDPTTLMAPFFFLFLGMCFGDAGYGLLLSGVFGYLLVKHDMSPTIRKFFMMLTIGMFCSIAFGALTGSWFGDSVTAFPFLSFLIPLKKAVQLLDPMKDPMTLLLISLGLGFIQVIFGLMIAFKNNWSHGNRVAALGDQGGWILFLCGLLCVGLSTSEVLPSSMLSASKILAAAGALTLIATQGREKASIAGKLFSGIMSLYNVTGFLGDVLSYSRLLALGLGSAAVGMVVNLLANLVLETQYIGIPLAVLIFVLGHAFSIAINLLGAFIHSLRLQYVEFFGKFYDANGRDFTPLRNSTVFAKLRENTAGR